MTVQKKIPYREILKIELEGWCYGIANYPGEMHSSLVHRIIEELRPTFYRALNERVEIDFLKLASKIAQASKYCVDERELVISMLSHLPNPDTLDEESAEYVQNAIDRVKKTFPDVEDILQLKWQLDEEDLDQDF